MVEEPRDLDPQGWHEQNVGKGILYSRTGTTLIEKPSSKSVDQQELKCGQNIYNAGTWGAVAPSPETCTNINCFVRSKTQPQRVSALITAKRSDSLGDNFVDENAHLIGTVSQIVRPVPSAPRARIFEDTVIKNYQCTTRIDVDINAYSPSNKYKDFVLNTSAKELAAPRRGERVFLFSKNGQSNGVITQADMTHRMDECWFIDLFAVKITTGMVADTAMNTDYYHTLIVNEAREPIGIVIPAKSGETMLCAKMSRILDQLDAVLL